MVKVNRPFLSLRASGRFGRDLRVTSRGSRQIVQATADPVDVKSLAQLSWRHMYLKAVALWHALSKEEKISWEGAATPRHMTGFAWFMSQCLKPNPGLYLPLQGGNMTGDIDMDGHVIEDLPDPANPQDADTLAAREAAIAAALEDCIDSHVHGWDGANWQKLLTESAALHNLRVRLYAGTNPITEGTVITALAATDRTLIVRNFPSVYNADTGSFLNWFGRSDSDARAGTSSPLVQARLAGFNGATWDRLRTYGTGILKVGRAEVGLQDLRRIGAGQVKASPGKLYWLKCNPAVAASVWELSDDLDGSTAVKIDGYHATRESHMSTFDPPLEFTTGIYLKTFTNMTSMVFGYL